MATKTTETQAEVSTASETCPICGFSLVRDRRRKLVCPHRNDTDHRRAARQAKAEEAPPVSPAPEPTEDTIVQVKGKDGEWTDYARTTRHEALTALEAGRLPGHSKPEPLRAVDWITHEPIEPAKAEPVSAVHTSASKLPSTTEQRERIEELYDSHAIPEEKKRAPENFTKLGAARWINLLESYPLREEGESEEQKAEREKAKAVRDADLAARKRAEAKTTRGRRNVTTERVQPQEPDYSKLPARSRAKAKREYQAALAAWKAAEEQAAETTIEKAKEEATQFTALYHATTKAEQYSLHRAGCRDIEREAEAHGSNVETFEADSVEAALEHMIDGELRELGYSTDDVKVHNCAKARKPAPKAKAAKSGHATSDGSAGAFDPSDPATRAEVVRLHTEGKLSMKAIAEKFGLPAVHKSWLAVSLVWRQEADARGLDRPRFPQRAKK